MNEEEAKIAAQNKVLELGGDYFPEDAWFCLSEEWDINIWTDESGGRQATIYPVKNGNTDVRKPIEINLVGLFSRSST